MLTVKEWQFAERFYNFYWPNIAILIVTVALVVLIIWLYGNKRVRRLNKWFIASILIVSVLTAWVYQNNRTYLNQVKWVTPQIRTVEPRYHQLVSYPDSLISLYRIYGKTDGLDQLPFYRQIETKEQFQLIGYDEDYAYIQITDEICVLPIRKISFENNLEGNDSSPLIEFVGRYYYLTDDLYKQIGFFEPEKAFVTKVVASSANKDLIYHPEPYEKLRRIEWRLMNRWLFNDFRYSSGQGVAPGF